MKVNRLQKGTTVIEINSLELEALQEMLELVQSYSSKFKGRDQLQQRHHDFIKYLNLQLEGSKQKLMAADKVQDLKVKLKDALRRSPERAKGSYETHYYYYWEMTFNPEKDFGIKIDCFRLRLYLSIGVGRYNTASLQIQPHDEYADSKYIKLDHHSTIEAALAGKSYLLKYLKDQIIAHITKNKGAEWEGQ